MITGCIDLMRDGKDIQEQREQDALPDMSIPNSIIYEVAWFAP